jgi:hypothetical protein
MARAFAHILGWFDRLRGPRDAAPVAEDLRELEVLLESDDLSIRLLPGRGDTLIVAFTGVGQGVGAIQKEEFIGIGSQDGQNHVVFVSARRRSWFSLPDMQDRILEVIGGYAQSNDLRKLVTIGNSMGGFGALLFAERLQASSAIAFVPQFTMHPEVLKESRWGKYRSQMQPAGLARLDEHLSGEVPAFAIFGGTETKDMRHMEALATCPNVQVWNITGAGHDVASVLKAEKVLEGAVSAMVDLDLTRLSALLSPRGVLQSGQPA